MAEVTVRYVRDPKLVEERQAAAKLRQAATKRKEAAKRTASRSAWQGIAGLKHEKTARERIKRLEREMLIAIRRGELIEKQTVQRQAAFLLTTLRIRCLSAPSAWSRRLLNIDDLEEIADLPERMADPDPLV